MNNRWWIYQKERFPLLAHGPMVLIFCLSVMLYSSLQYDELPSFWRISGAVISALILFFQLRVADEFKDFDIDMRYRPERPVQRGVISLEELARWAKTGAVIQFLVAISTDVGLLPILALVWAYMGLMTREFFVPAWLERHPVAYLLSHMLVMPLIAFYVSAFDWLCQCRAMPSGLGWILSFSFAAGLTLELGRKIRTPVTERQGIETYSSLWGPRVATVVWAGAVLASVLAWGKATTVLIGASIYLLLGLAVLVFAGIVAAMTGSRSRQASGARLIEPASGLVAMALYLGLGPLPFLLS